MILLTLQLRKFSSCLLSFCSLKTFRFHNLIHIPLICAHQFCWSFCSVILSVWFLFLWVVKSFLYLYVFSQRPHLNLGFFPVSFQVFMYWSFLSIWWILSKWKFRSLFCLNLLSQKLHFILFSEECTYFLWLSKLTLAVKEVSHSSHLKDSDFLWCTLTWWLRACFMFCCNLYTWNDYSREHNSYASSYHFLEKIVCHNVDKSVSCRIHGLWLHVGNQSEL